MSSPEVGRGSGSVASASFTADRSWRDETEPSRQFLLPPLTASGERGAPREGWPPEDPPPLDGFIKHYEIIRKLGEGGMGVVLLARDTKLGRLVAIKLLQDRGRVISRLLAEAQATARCRHENIVVIHEVDETDGHP